MWCSTGVAVSAILASASRTLPAAQRCVVAFNACASSTPTVASGEAHRSSRCRHRRLVLRTPGRARRRIAPRRRPRAPHRFRRGHAGSPLRRTPDLPRLASFDGRTARDHASAAVRGGRDLLRGVAVAERAERAGPLASIRQGGHARAVRCASRPVTCCSWTITGCSTGGGSSARPAHVVFGARGSSNVRSSSRDDRASSDEEHGTLR